MLNYLRIFVVFPINFFLFGAIFYLIYEIATGGGGEGGEEQEGEEGKGDTSSSSAAKGAREVLKEGVVGDVTNKVNFFF